MIAVATGLRVVAALAAGARPAARRRSSVVHLYVGPVSRSGRYGTTAGRTLCGVRSLRLPLLEPAGTGLDLGGRRFCRRCTSLLSASLGRDVHRLATQDDSRHAYGHLTVVEFRQAAAWTRTVDDTHQVARIAAAVLGDPKLHGRRTPDEQAVYDLDRALIARRDRLRVAELSDEQKAANVAAREAEAEDRRRTRKERRLAIARERAQERTRQGLYVRPEEQALVDSA